MKDRHLLRIRLGLFFSVLLLLLLGLACVTVRLFVAGNIEYYASRGGERREVVPLAGPGLALVCERERSVLAARVSWRLGPCSIRTFSLPDSDSVSQLPCEQGFEDARRFLDQLDRSVPDRRALYMEVIGESGVRDYRANPLNRLAGYRPNELTRVVPVLATAAEKTGSLVFYLAMFSLLGAAGTCVPGIPGFETLSGSIFSWTRWLAFLRMFSQKLVSFKLSRTGSLDRHSVLCGSVPETATTHLLF